MHCPGSVFCVTLAGLVRVGFCSSLTVTVNEHEAGLFAKSVTLQVTVVVPAGNEKPDAGVQDTWPTPEQLSEAVGVVKLTVAVQELAAMLAVMLAGQESVGAWASVTVTVKEQAGVPPALLQETVVVPMGKVEPAGGVQVMVPQLPLVVGAG